MTGQDRDRPTVVAGPQTRRSFLVRLGLVSASVAVTGTAGLTWRAWDQGVFATGQGPAYRAWTAWRDLSGPERAAAMGILAASAHNSQPWVFVLDQDRIELHADTTRTIGTIDPFGRELETSLGCALENLSLTLSSEDISHQVTLMDNRDDTLAAAVLIGADQGSASGELSAELVDEIPRRHSNRAPYRDEPLPVGLLDDLSELVDASADTTDADSVRLVWLTEPGDRDLYGSLLIEAVEGIVADEDQSADSNTWYRHDWDELQARKDGITPDAQASSAVLRASIKLLPATSRSQNDDFFVEATRKNVPTAAAFGLIAVDDPQRRSDRLSGGRVLERLHLAATSRGIGFQHLNYVTERIDRTQQLGIDEPYTTQLRQFLGPDQQLLASFRIGIAASPSRPSPRRPLEEVRK